MGRRLGKKQRTWDPEKGRLVPFEFNQDEAQGLIGTRERLIPRGSEDTSELEKSVGYVEHLINTGRIEN